MTVITIAADTPYLDRHAAFLKLWADAKAAAGEGETVRNLGGNRIDVSPAIARALKGVDTIEPTVTNAPVVPEAPRTTTAKNSPAKKAAAKKSTTKRAPARKSAARKSTR